MMSQTKFYIEPPAREDGRWEVLKTTVNHPKAYWIVARLATETEAQAMVERLSEPSRVIPPNSTAAT
jgi:hypothetical protein